MEDPMAPLMIMPANGAEDGEPEVFPEEMWLRVIQAVSDREEKILRMKEFKIYEVPSAISEATSLCVLDLSWNSIVDLPSSISCLTNLTELYVDHNALESLPDGVGNLTNLRILHLQANKLHYLPESLCRLPKLQHAKVVLNPFKFEEKPRFVELPSLLDLSLEKYLKNMDGQNNNNLPFDLLDRIDQANVCNWCEKKYFGKGVVLPRNMVIAKSVKAVYQGTVCSLKCAYEIYDDARLNSKKPVDFDNSQMNDITRSVNNMNKLMKSAYAKVQRKNMLVINPGAGFDEQKEKMLFLSFVIQILEITDEDDEKESLCALTEAIDTSYPAVVVCGSNGSKIFAKFCESGIFRGNVLFVEKVDSSLAPKFVLQKVCVCLDDPEKEKCEFESWKCVKKLDLNIFENLTNTIEDALKK